MVWLAILSITMAGVMAIFKDVASTVYCSAMAIIMTMLLIDLKSHGRV